MDIEKAPHISKDELVAAMLHQPSRQVGEMIDKINETSTIGMRLSIRNAQPIAHLYSYGPLWKAQGADVL